MQTNDSNTAADMGAGSRIIQSFIQKQEYMEAITHDKFIRIMEYSNQVLRGESDLSIRQIAIATGVDQLTAQKYFDQATQRHMERIRSNRNELINTAAEMQREEIVITPKLELRGEKLHVILPSKLNFY